MKHEQMPLNKYLAHAGIGSRRKVVELIAEGKVQINGVCITDPGHRVSMKDTVLCNSKMVMQESKVYILLNKPKNCVTTVSDERGRKTVLDAIIGASRARVYPVGRLDRDTTGLLLLTNDGELAQQLSHPSHETYKVYHVTLDKPLVYQHEHKLRQGIELEDGIVTIDNLTAISGTHRKTIAVALHSGRYRIVRRMFEYLGYTIKKLDRPFYAGLTKKGLRVGNWRFLALHEVAELKNLQKECC